MWYAGQLSIQITSRKIRIIGPSTVHDWVHEVAVFWVKHEITGVLIHVIDVKYKHLYQFKWQSDYTSTHAIS